MLAYSTKKAARPATPARPCAATVAIGEPAPGADVDAAPPAELVALWPADEADESADDAELLADAIPLEAELLAELMALDAEPEAEDAPEAADPVAPPIPKIVVLPVVLPAEFVSALVVTADEDPPELAPPTTV